jgi:hypothetical protein
MLHAVEDGAAILACMHLLEAKWCEGASRVQGLGAGGALWQERLGVWAHFSESSRRTVPGSALAPSSVHFAG